MTDLRLLLRSVLVDDDLDDLAPLVPGGLEPDSVANQEKLHPGDLVLLDPNAILRHSTQLFEELDQEGAFDLILLVLDGPMGPRLTTNVLYKGVPTKCMSSLLRRVYVHDDNSI